MQSPVSCYALLQEDYVKRYHECPLNTLQRVAAHHFHLALSFSSLFTVPSNRDCLILRSRYLSLKRMIRKLKLRELFFEISVNMRTYLSFSSFLKNILNSLMCM